MTSPSRETETSSSSRDIRPDRRGDARVLKFDKTGKFIKSWGGKGKGPGQFEVAHGIAIDAQGLLWVTDRENQRIQIFDGDGTFVRELKYAGLPCSLDIGRQYIYMVNGFAGQILQMDLNGKVLAATGKAGTGPGRIRRSACHCRQSEGRVVRRGLDQQRAAEVREEMKARDHGADTA